MIIMSTSRIMANNCSIVDINSSAFLSHQSIDMFFFVVVHPKSNCCSFFQSFSYDFPQPFFFYFIPGFIFTICSHFKCNALVIPPHAVRRRFERLKLEQCCWMRHGIWCVINARRDHTMCYWSTMFCTGYFGNTETGTGTLHGLSYFDDEVARATDKKWWTSRVSI